VVAKGVAYYRGVRGSAALATARLHGAAIPAEGLAPGEMRRLPFAGELLGAARVRHAYAAIPLEALDRAGEALEAEEQAAYLHLLRLSYGEGRNWARVGKRELMERLRLSERRLLRVLDALVAKAFARPLHRDNRGTLWRVALPREAFGEPLGDDVLLGRAAPAPVDAAPPDGRQVTRSSSSSAAVGPSVRPAPRRGAGGEMGPTLPARGPTPAAPTSSGPARSSTLRERELARSLCAARRQEGDGPLAAALREVRELLDEGQSPRRIAAAIAAVGRRAARAGEAEVT
jgi:hypothetical protein